jgi:hypothetical protein
MRIRIVAVLLCLAAFFADTALYGNDGIEPGMMDQSLRVFDGKVVSVDLSAPSLTLEGAIDMVFKISPDTVFRKDVYDIGLSDVKVGDYVSVQCRRTDSEFKVLKVTVKYPFD